VTTGYLVGLFQFVFFWALTAIYVRRANGEFDELTKQVIQEAQALERSAGRKTEAA
jgi:cation/acetate symporter